MSESFGTSNCSPMDTQIFNQGLSVMATSAYIIIAALLGDGMKPELEVIEARWNATGEDLKRALAELKAFNIIERHPGPGGNNPIYIINPASLWGREQGPA